MSNKRRHDSSKDNAQQVAPRLNINNTEQRILDTGQTLESAEAKYKENKCRESKENISGTLNSKIKGQQRSVTTIQLKETYTMSKKEDSESEVEDTGKQKHVGESSKTSKSCEVRKDYQIPSTSTGIRDKNPQIKPCYVKMDYMYQRQKRRNETDTESSDESNNIDEGTQGSNSEDENKERWITMGKQEIDARITEKCGNPDKETQLWILVNKFEEEARRNRLAADKIRRAIARAKGLIRQSPGRPRKAEAEEKQELMDHMVTKDCGVTKKVDREEKRTRTRYPKDAPRQRRSMHWKRKKRMLQRRKETIENKKIYMRYFKRIFPTRQEKTRHQQALQKIAKLSKQGPTQRVEDTKGISQGKNMGDKEVTKLSNTETEETIQQGQHSRDSTQIENISDNESTDTIIRILETNTPEDSDIEIGIREMEGRYEEWEGIHYESTIETEQNNMMEKRN